MSVVEAAPIATLPLAPAKRIRMILPDDGTDRRVLRALLRDKGISRASTVAVRAVGVLHTVRTKKGKLPEAELARLVTVIVTPAQADAIFEFVCNVANIARPGGGIVLLQPVLGTTEFVLPRDVPDESD